MEQLAALQRGAVEDGETDCRAGEVLLSYVGETPQGHAELIDDGKSVMFGDNI